ncbi:RNA-directed DNA polymerase from mobile element jockey [Eumeta japonica]|uniref:RNA-directed DNA polymerase from mobile element jockey n=1 Tax=Eumeta variegata TaxID=151549 RepID=A0A4C1VGF7_EUMVA|nr:RNA-directed DNA polymerase from mobile element jockey [Eumeta japonica]
MASVAPGPLAVGGAARSLQPLPIECTRLHINFTKAQNTKSGIKITVASIEGFRNLNRCLIQNNLLFHTFALEEERKVKAVIKDIPTELDIGHIKEDLYHQGYRILEVHRMHRRDGSALGMVLAILEKNDKAKEFFKILGNICDLSGILEEAPYKKRAPGQCHRCQLYGHAAANCYAQPRCVKCLVPHWTKDCESSKESGGKPSYCNCGQGHTANYRECPEAPKPKPFVAKKVNCPNKLKLEKGVGRPEETSILNNIPNDIVSTDDIDNAIGALTNNISTVVENGSRTVPMKSNRRELPRDISELIRDKNASLRRASKYPTCQNRSHVRALQRKVRARMQEVRNNNWSNLMSEISSNHKAYWGLTEVLKTEGAVPTPALKRPDSSIAFDDWEKAEFLADTIELQCSINPSFDSEHVRRVEEEVRQRVSLSSKEDLDPITLDEVSEHIKALKIRKARGKDSISSKALKCFSAPLVALLVAIFNACIENCYFPTGRKEAIVIGILKPEKPRDLSASYRFISLLSILVIITSFTFRLDNTYSSMRPIRAEVPHGFTLSPLLYSAYINDIPRLSTGVQLPLFADDTALFLRSNYFRNILPRLQRAIDELTQWLRLWRIEINPKKSASLYFDFSTRKSTVPVPVDTPFLKNLNEPIPWQHYYKYLGITIDRHLHFKYHIARVTKFNVILLISAIRNDRRATDAPWYVKNSILHRDLELPTISKFMKDVSECFFDIANSHQNPLLVETVSYEPLPPNHFCRRPRNVLLDPPDDLTVEVEKLIELNKMAIVYTTVYVYSLRPSKIINQVRCPPL